MSQDWLVAMGLDVRYPHGFGIRSLVGHRLLLALCDGPKSARRLHVALGGKVPAAVRRTALEELRAVGLVASSVLPSGARGGRPGVEWSLRFPGSVAVAAAKAAVLACESQARRHRRSQAPLPAAGSPPERDWNYSAGLGVRRRRRLVPVPVAVAEQVCDWVASGRYLKTFCRRKGAPSARTIYAWAAKDPVFRARLGSARAFGEELILEELLEIVDSPLAACLSADRSASRTFYRRCVRPVHLRLQRWRRHPRRQGTSPR